MPSNDCGLFEVKMGELDSWLVGTPFAGFSYIAPDGAQLPALIATYAGIKRCTDLWIAAERWSAFKELIARTGMPWVLDTVFDHEDSSLEGIHNSRFNTTRAAWAKRLTAGTEAHVFVARHGDDLQECRARGWYPLVWKSELIEKHPVDHVGFGEMLGYPDCCQAFFHRRNSWWNDNTPYAAMGCTDAPDWQANGLLRHTAAGLISHMPCRYDCPSTKVQSAERLAAIAEYSGPYAAWIEARLKGTFLILSERAIFRLEASQRLNGGFVFEYAEAVPPTTDHPLRAILGVSDSVAIDGALVLTAKDGIPGRSYIARADQYGPECPFMVCFS